jgi:hypothetical protein
MGTPMGTGRVMPGGAGPGRRGYQAGTPGTAMTGMKPGT